LKEKLGVKEKEGRLGQRVTRGPQEVKENEEPKEERVPRVHQAYREQMVKREKWDRTELMVMLDQWGRAAGREPKVVLARTEDLDKGENPVTLV